MFFYGVNNFYNIKSGQSCPIQNLNWCWFTTSTAISSSEPEYPDG